MITDAGAGTEEDIIYSQVVKRQTADDVGKYAYMIFLGQGIHCAVILGLLGGPWLLGLSQGSWKQMICGSHGKTGSIQQAQNA